MILETVYLGAQVLACLLTLWIASRAWLNRGTAGATALGATALLAALWAGAAVGLTLSTGDAAQLRWLQISYVGIIWTPVTFAVLALSYTGHTRYLTPQFVGGLAAVGGAFLALVWTNPAHHLFWADIVYDAAVPKGVSTVPGPAFWAFVVFAYVQLFVGSVLLVRYALTAPGLYRVQTAALLVAVAAPWAANIPTSLQIVSVDLTPVALSVTAVAVWVAMFRYRLTTFAPVALRTVFESISTGVYVLDRQGQVVDVNRTGKDLLALDDEVVGTPLVDHLPESVAEQFQEIDDGEQKLVEFDPGQKAPSGPRYYTVRATPVETSRGRRKGRLLAVSDITERQRQRQQLETQNQQLQEFTSVVSHDLRNPLNVAAGHLDLAQQECESTHLDTVEQGLTRMERLVEDLLALARQGVETDDPEQVSLPEVTDAAWATVETKDATLHNRATVAVVADRSRLRQLLENLVRNAVEHGGEDVTVTIGDRPGGFYIADDGPGVSPTDQDEVFDTGYSTATDGTGFGLSIVQQVAEAHNWEVEVADSAAGGARFDVTGVTTAE